MRLITKFIDKNFSSFLSQIVIEKKIVLNLFVRFQEMPESEEHVRPQWNSSFQFMLAAVSYAVGLGNIWRFPALAYENGGFSFLISYLFVSFIIGFPLLYLELSLGQYARAGPAVLHGRIRPLFQGLGWGMVIMAILVCIYYVSVLLLQNTWVIDHLFCKIG